LREKWLRLIIAGFAIVVAVQVMEAQPRNAGPQKLVRVRLYQDAKGKLLADPDSVRVPGDGTSTIMFYGDKIDVVIKFKSNKVCGTDTLKGNSNVEITCNVPRRCVKNGTGSEHDSCGHHKYLVMKQRASAKGDPEIVIDEGMSQTAAH
jgi:hypothetical protein